MPSLPTQSFATIVSNVVAGFQGRASKLINFAIGASLRAIAEAFAGIMLWFQALVLQLLLATRLSTSSNVDVDTFTADWMEPVGISNGVESPRLGARASSGQATFSRFTAAPSTCFVPAAASVSPEGVITNAGPNNAATLQTSDRSQTFVVIADTTNTAYSSVLGGYTLAALVTSVNVTVQALVPGSAGNVVLGALSVMTSPITGIDTVTNAAAFDNGFDQESDPQLKARFPLFIQSLQKATEGAVGYAIVSTQLGLQWQFWNNMDPDGSTDYGAFTVFVDDGSGAIPDATLAKAASAVFAIAAAGSRPQIVAASTLLANVTMTITTRGVDHPTAVGQVDAAVSSYIAGLGLGEADDNELVSGSLSYIKLGAVAVGIPGVTDVTGFTINGVAADLVPAMGQTIKPGTIVVS